MRFLVGLIFVTCGLFLVIAAKQVSRDSMRKQPVGQSSLVGRVTPMASRIAGGGCLILAVIWWFA